MAFIAADSYHSTIATIGAGSGQTSFTVTSASGFPTLGTGDFTVMRIDDLGTPEDVTCTAISGTTVTCLATTAGHAATNTIDGAIWAVASYQQTKDDSQSGFPVNALSAAGALVKGTGIRNHITISAAATFTLANGTYTGECCRVSMDRTATAQATVDPAGGTTWDGATTIALFAGDVIIGAWDGTGWITLDKYSSFSSIVQNFIANNFYWANLSSEATGQVGSSTTTRYVPFFVPYTITISQLGARVGTTSGGGNFCIGVYANGTNNQPTGTCLGNTGNLSTASAAVVTGALGANLQLTPGYYWFAFQVDNATATFGSLAPTNSIVGFLAGVGTASNLSNASGNTGTVWTATTTYGTFGASPTITETNIATAQLPVVIMKIASVP